MATCKYFPFCHIISNRRLVCEERNGEGGDCVKTTERKSKMKVKNALHTEAVKLSGILKQMKESVIYKRKNWERVC